MFKLNGRASLLLLCLLALSGRVSAAPEAIGIEFWNDSEPNSAMQANHAVWQSILTKYLDDKHPSRINRFDYRAVSNVDMVRLSDYLDYLTQLDPRQFNKDEQKAYWINLYNAKTIELVTRNVRSDGIDSIRAIRSSLFRPGPWRKKRLTIAGQDLSLDDIEHGILRPFFNDRRIHYVVNCASLGCPNLLKTAFTAENTETIKTQAEQQFLTHPRALSMRGDTLVLSEIFDWYAADFAQNPQELLDYLKSFQVAPVARAVDRRTSIRFEYDWALNKP